MARPAMNRDGALNYLCQRIDYERALVVPYGEAEYKLQRMRELLERLDRPQDGLPIVHVAGTKGKGSTSAMIAAMLSAAGYRIGLFTSPHLERIEERFQIDGQPCPSDQFVRLVEQLRPVVEAMDTQAAGERPEIGPTYFELTTALALRYFQQSRVDLAVLEVGLGGRLDSTNVCDPRVCVITSISFDHMKQLGNTLTAIAGEKAGIIKPGVPVVSGVTFDEPREVVERRAAQLGCRCVQLQRDFTVDYHPAATAEPTGAWPSINFHAHQGAFRQLERVPIGLLGRHQGANAAVALATINELAAQGWRLDESAVRRGLAQVRMPARIEVLRREPTVILDAAHNVASIEALVQTLDESFPRQRRTLIYATTRDKDLPGMLARLVPAFERLVFTQYQSNPRRVEASELLDVARQVVDPALVAERCCVESTPSAAWQRVLAASTAQDLICISGSFFIAAELRGAVVGRGGSGE